MRISNDEIACMRLFYEATGVEASDCIISDDGIAFLVPQGQMGRAIGKGGANIQRLRTRTNRSIFLFEDAPDEEAFLRKSLNLSSPHIQESEKSNKKVVYVKLSAPDMHSMKRGAAVSFAKGLFERIFGKELRIQSR